MKKVLTFGGVIIIIISLSLLYNSIRKKSVEFYGQEIKVSVIDIPISCDVSSKDLKAFFRFLYKNKTYSKNLKDKYCELVKTNKTINLKTNSDNSIFIYVDENVNKELFFNAILLIIGVLIYYKSIKL